MAPLTSKAIRYLAGYLIAVCMIGPALTQEFPTRPLKIVVGFGAGGLGDTMSRIVAQKLTESLGKPVVIENMPGAGGITAATTVARAAPDGHTMLLVSGQNAASPSLFKSLPYDLATDFAMIATIGVFDFVIMVKNDSPLKTVQDLITSAKRNPDTFNIGTITVGSVQNLSALMFMSKTGLQVPTIPFRTVGEVQAALLSGEVQVSFETYPAAIEQIRSGILRPLAIMSEQRRSYLPDLPTVAESGVPDFKLVSWNGFVAPAKTPREIIQRLNKAFTDAVAAPDVRKRFTSLGLTAYASTPDEMRRFYDEDVIQWRNVIAGAKIQPR